jgi:hypothetical protein
MHLMNKNTFKLKCLRAPGYSELKWCGKEVRVLIIGSSRTLFVPHKEGGKCTCMDEL